MIKYERKIQKTSKTTYTVSLPIDWIRKCSLQKNEDVLIEDFNNFLIIKPKDMEKTKIEKNVEKYPKHLIEQIIIGAYIRNIDKIVLTNLTKEKLPEIKKFVEECLFGSFIEYKPSQKELEIFFITDEYSLSRHKILYHLFYLVEWFLKISRDSITTKFSKKKLSQMDEMDKEVDKYYYLSMRLYPNEYLSRYATIIENMADSLINIGELKRLSKKDKETISTILQILEEKFSLAVQYYTYRNIKELSSITQDLKKLNIKLRKTKYSYTTEPVRLLRDLCEAMIDELLS